VKNTKSIIYDHKDLFISLAVVVLFLFLYGKTLAVGLLISDSAEFQVLSRELGLTHAMGYPIYILLGKLFSLLPVKELPWRINLLSAVSASLALGLLYLLARLVTRNRWIALAAPLACGLTGIFWQNAIIAEVYATSMLASNLILLQVLLWRKTRNAWFLAGAGFIGGLGLGIHSMVLLFGPAILIFLVVGNARRKDWLMASAGAIAGLLILFGCYYWLAARDPAAGNIQTVILPNSSRYGLTPDDLDTPLERAIFIATARQFTGTLFSLPFNQVLIYIRTYFVSLLQSVGIPWSLLALAGLVAAFIPNKNANQRWQEGLLLGVTWLILILLPANYAIRTGIIVFFVASYNLVAILAVFGLDALVSVLSRWLDGIKSVSTAKIRAHASSILGLLVFILVGAFFSIKLDPLKSQPARPISDTSDIKLADIQWTHYYTSKELAQTTVAQIEDGSLVFSDWRMLYALQYVAIIQKAKPNVTFIEYNPYPGMPTLTQTELDMIESSFPNRTIYFTRTVKQLEKDYRFVRSDIEPYIYRLEKK
jgi:hypothetical protein